MTYQLIVQVNQVRLPPPDLDDAPEDVPIPLEWAVDLAELGGHFTPKRMRKAIADGLLPAERHGRGFYVTRRGIREWRKRCRVRASRPDFSSTRGEPTAGPAGAGRDTGSSATGTSDIGLAAARTTVQALRERLRIISPAGTPKPTPSPNSRRRRS